MSQNMSQPRGERPDSSPGSIRPLIDSIEDGKVGQLEIIISYVLRVGVMLSLLITLIGLVLLFVADPANAVVRPSGPPVPHEFGTVLMDLAQLRPKAIIDAGLILLILTPVARVAVTVVAFVLERDAIYMLITLFVLMVLLASFILGRVG